MWVVAGHAGSQRTDGSGESGNNTASDTPGEMNTQCRRESSALPGHYPVMAARGEALLA